MPDDGKTVAFQFADLRSEFWTLFLGSWSLRSMFIWHVGLQHINAKDFPFHRVPQKQSFVHQKNERFTGCAFKSPVKNMNEKIVFGSGYLWSHVSYMTCYLSGFELLYECLFVSKVPWECGPNACKCLSQWKFVIAKLSGTISTAAANAHATTCSSYKIIRVFLTHITHPTPNNTRLKYPASATGNL